MSGWAGMTLDEKANVDAFAAEWLKSQGYKPAPFQKAMALQRLRRGETAAEIVAALVAMRI